jgi:hypothetical protein
MSVGTVGLVGWNGQREMRARNQKEQAKLNKRTRKEMKKGRAPGQRAAQPPVMNVVVQAPAQRAAQPPVMNVVVQAPAQQPLAAAANPTLTARPGWYADPHGSATYRYWDGATWTEHTA